MTVPTPTLAVRVLRMPKRLRGRGIVFASLAVLAVVTLAAILAPWVAPYDPDAVDFTAFYAPPSPAHWLGTDSLGRDLLSRIVWGGRTALLGPLLVVTFSTALGILLGLVAGWRGGWIDAVLGRVFDVLFAFPSLLIAMMAVALFGKGLVAPVIAMSISYAPFVARLTRSLVAAERTRPYVAAYRVQGFGGAWIALRRVLPNIAPIVGAQSTLNFGYVLAELAGLSFLGLGVQPPTADWGAMINEAQGGIAAGQFLPAIAPAVVVVLVVVAVNIVGEDLSDRIGGEIPA
ncbi:ABC transporter permease [Microbacterium azadirachtae]|uniref:ABC transporter permease n=1 Tax=Microbacterium azadirachtae TaxID=582680 RepID=UPI00087EF7C4|nr:ABC transporter permease [Microbacterium azadirachtae]UXW86101.1 ABC transporter permease [Microbacterium azadirachtae]SDL63325.1 peptide/nickel transport system permease protein [Microbacterium azadirachtae]SEF92322.1 peptide/nickel transport system permease protein [Microbacterium azadirachtae]SEF94623.1 peptide/nickel transport system permease protein [Microbacterium azadirachtae]